MATKNSTQISTSIYDAFKVVPAKEALRQLSGLLPTNVVMTEGDSKDPAILLAQFAVKGQTDSIAHSIDEAQEGSRDH